MTACNPLIIHHSHEGTWQVWCRPCHWESPYRDQHWQARLDKQKHLGIDDDTVIPMWARGPGKAPP